MGRRPSGCGWQQRCGILSQPPQRLASGLSCLCSDLTFNQAGMTFSLFFLYLVGGASLRPGMRPGQAETLPSRAARTGLTLQSVVQQLDSCGTVVQQLCYVPMKRTSGKVLLHRTLSHLSQGEAQKSPVSSISPTPPFHFQAQIFTVYLTYLNLLFSKLNLTK